MSNDSSQDQEIIKILKDLESREAEYPAELMAARRMSFMQQVEERTQPQSGEELTPLDQTTVGRLQILKAVPEEYPAGLFARRRAAFLQQVRRLSRVSVWDAVRSFAQDQSPGSLLKLGRASLIAASLALMAYMGLALSGKNNSLTNAIAPSGITSVGHPFTSPTPKAEIMCKEGYEPPLCLAQKFSSKGDDLIYAGNGLARPAVAKDTLPGYEEVHDAAYVNDGLYGPGASWVSNSRDSWIKMDLGKPAVINTVTFGRDRLGTLNDRDPGQFVISVAVSDDVYADGNSSNDEIEYVEVYNSKKSGFTGIISGPETVMAHFKLLKARYIKITFENAGTAIDEVEVFLSPPSTTDKSPTREPLDEEPPASTLTPPPTAMPLPTETATPLPTNTLIPTETPTAVPTTTPIPTDTPIPSDTPVPPPTDTPVPPPTEALPPFLTDIPTVLETGVFSPRMDGKELFADDTR
jgi:hypothetical protein